MSTVISFENISKRYRIGAGRGSLRDAFSGLTSRLLGNSEAEAKRTLWALQDVSFHVQAGETFGLVGPNGAGKSTILKLLSRITRPTSGHFNVQGSVAALIEVGAGFHPDLTGRENIYLNAAILGMSDNEIRRKFDSIVAFAELEPFIDTPVKRYSSGMYVRLGFSVAVHVDPDVLLVDEVLAVGDYMFREKCIEKINEFRQSGKTMVVVSHDRSMLEKLCDRALLLYRGQDIRQGNVREVLDEYYTGKYRENEREIDEGVMQQTGVSQNRRAVDILEVRLLDCSSSPRHSFLSGEPVTIQARFRCNRAVKEPVFYCDIHHEYTWVIGTNSARTGAAANFQAGQEGLVEMTISSLNLLSGSYHLDLGVVSDYFAWRPYHIVYKAASFDVSANLEQGEGLVHLPHSWQFISTNGSEEGVHAR